MVAVKFYNFHTVCSEQSLYFDDFFVKTMVSRKITQFGIKHEPTTYLHSTSYYEILGNSRTHFRVCIRPNIRPNLQYSAEINFGCFGRALERCHLIRSISVVFGRSSKIDRKVGRQKTTSTDLKRPTPNTNCGISSIAISKLALFVV